MKDISRVVETDVLIIGSGVAGTFTALMLDPGLKCIVINKAGNEQSNSMYAQGGVAAVSDAISSCDDTQKHFRDTIEAGAGLCDEKAVRVLVDEAWENIERSMELGVVFDRRDGRLLLTREGGHSENRILHSGGDATGLHMTKGLLETLAERDNITIMEKMFLADILLNDSGNVAGAMVLDKQNIPMVILAPSVVIASGGIGRIFKNSTNAKCATGDGIGAAMRAGAEVKDMEFVQFHPTAFVHPDDTGRYFLISEALRGEGAVLRNRNWQAFMKDIHPLADLAPRDIVARAIINEMKKSNIPNVYLDITSKPRKFLKERFPTIYDECMNRGIDIASDWIPVIPVQHYFMGGIRTDLDARTNIPGLYACGESACTGVHGANRLASNSLVECMVFGSRCARDISSSERRKVNKPNIKFSGKGEIPAEELETCGTEIRNILTKKCGIIRKRAELIQARDRLTEMEDRLRKNTKGDCKSMQTYNQAQVGLEIVRACIAREKSIGAHYIEE